MIPEEPEKSRRKKTSVSGIAILDVEKEEMKYPVHYLPGLHPEKRNRLTPAAISDHDPIQEINSDRSSSTIRKALIL